MEVRTAVNDPGHWLAEAWTPYVTMAISSNIGAIVNGDYLKAVANYRQ